MDFLCFHPSWRVWLLQLLEAINREWEVSEDDAETSSSSLQRAFSQRTEREVSLQPRQCPQSLILQATSSETALKAALSGRHSRMCVHILLTLRAFGDAASSYVCCFFRDCCSCLCFQGLKKKSTLQLASGHLVGEEFFGALTAFQGPSSDTPHIEGAAQKPHAQHAQAFEEEGGLYAQKPPRAWKISGFSARPSCPARNPLAAEKRSSPLQPKQKADEALQPSSVSGAAAASTETPPACPKPRVFTLPLTGRLTCARLAEAARGKGNVPSRDPEIASQEEPQKSRKGAAGEGGHQATTASMRFVLGGLETSVEEALEGFFDALAFSGRRFGRPSAPPSEVAMSAGWMGASSSIAVAGSRGAAVGEGESSVMTWVLAPAGGDDAGDTSRRLAEERDVLLEALEFAFSLHAEEVMRERKASGLFSTGSYAPAGAPLAATLQVSFDSVPLHEQRILQAEWEEALETSLWERVGGEDSLEEAFYDTLITPGKAQLSGEGMNNAPHVDEGGDNRRHLRGLFEAMVRGLEGPEGATALEVLSLSLEDLRIILALEEETGGPLSLVVVEDWGESAEVAHILGDEEKAAFLVGQKDGTPQTLGLEGGEEGDSAAKEEEGLVDDNYWHWLIEDPGAW
ncbi:hypothetical protein cyc_02236 [Cyclospora cayetanensis]|uniref:Uncharacterized protein n=1 Tax=Cyclospora cayetanensis TaxID=88456 RepID=A0A1D3D8V1_9EIME|nr:hypothetical protein cyc_02236 [Cyclospora cayetanensis]